MTEAEWAVCVDLRPMLAFLQCKVSERKLRLFAVACCRRVWDLLPGNESRRAVDVAEKFADHPDNPILGVELTTSNAGAEAETNPEAFDRENPAWWVSHHSCDISFIRECAGWVAGCVAGGRITDATHRPIEQVWQQAFSAEQAIQTDILRDVIGDPFHPVGADAAWLTPNVLAVARQTYESRDFAQMPTLADALQDAGCNNADILAHCRGSGPHVRGCWVVDLILGKQ